MQGRAVTGPQPHLTTALGIKPVLALADPVFSARDPRLAGLTLSGPVSGQNLARLPFHDELTTFAALVPPTRRRILLGLEATIAGLQSQQLAGYAIIHLATHAVIDDRRPELSQIVLSVADRTGRPARSLLRANELAALALDGSTVVLSACDTALGKETPGEGLTGFTSALFQAGAAQLVLSLAKIDAEAASLFLSKMYGGALGTPGFSNEHAVRLARIALAESARWRDPYYWASIVIYGRLSATE